MANKKLLIIGCGEFAQIAYEYFTHDSDYTVVAFSVEQDYLDRPELLGLPVVAFEELSKSFSPKDYEVFVAVPASQLNRLRTRLYLSVKEKGYSLATYISSHAFVWPNAKIGENTFIFEDNVIQPFTDVGNNVVMWSGNHLGHRSIIEDNCFISSHVVISGFCRIGSGTFIGVNTSIGDEVNIGKDNYISMGAIINKSTGDGNVIKSAISEVSKVSAYKLCKVQVEK